MRKRTLLIILVLLLLGIPSHPSAQFNSYWNQGKAEITSYILRQARYGEIHEGHAVLVFVTEDFSSTRHVKLDNPKKIGENAERILKCNRVKKFLTGVYPYSMMVSTFTPVNYSTYPFTWKTSMSSQEWCGHTFTQLNRRSNRYAVHTYSYFETERDQTYELEDALLEEDIWNRIRIDPNGLPMGKVKMIPGTMASRTLHFKLGVEDALISIDESKAEGISHYRIEYPRIGRILTIHFKKTFPHEIIGWEESYVSGWGTSAQRLTTTAVRKKTILMDYWTRHRNSHRSQRALLELPLQ